MASNPESPQPTDTVKVIKNPVGAGIRFTVQTDVPPQVSQVAKLKSEVFTILQIQSGHWLPLLTHSVVSPGLMAFYDCLNTVPVLLILLYTVRAQIIPFQYLGLSLFTCPHRSHLTHHLSVLSGGSHTYCSVYCLLIPNVPYTVCATVDAPH